MVHIINLNAIYHLHSFFYLDDVNITHLDKALSTLMMFSTLIKQYPLLSVDAAFSTVM